VTPLKSSRFRPEPGHAKADPGNISDPANREIVARIRTIYAGLPVRERYWVAVRGAQHFNFSDQALLKAPTIARASGMTGSIDPVRGLEVAAGMIHWFFDAALEGTLANRGADLPGTYPEATLIIPPDQARLPSSIRAPSWFGGAEYMRACSVPASSSSSRPSWPCSPWARGWSSSAVAW
jgi:hypothetical protein